MGQSESRYSPPLCRQGETCGRLGEEFLFFFPSLLIFFHFKNGVWFVPFFASCAAPRSACLSLSSQWPILHHRWGRQKGETTARLLFGETRSVQLSERRGREGERERDIGERMEQKNCLHVRDGETSKSHFLQQCSVKKYSRGQPHVQERLICISDAGVERTKTI